MSAEHIPAYRAAAALEALLGDPADADNPFSFASSLAADERETPPARAADALHAWGVFEHLVPQSLGGRWGSIEELLALLRVVARRDLTVAFGIGPNLLGALPVWIAGSPEQKSRVAELLRRGDGLALANTERSHGTDLLANETRATACDAGYRLTGEKWLISNAARCGAWTVFARTGGTTGPRGLSLFLVDKERIPASCWRNLARVKTLGLRGGDLGGVRFRECPVPADAVIGEAGSGFETLHKTLAVTRTLCAGLSLGAADTALRLAADFAATRRLFGGTAAELPHPRALLAGAFVDILIGDAVATASARAVQAGDAPLFASALAKFLVPTMVENVCRDLSVVLGARFFLRNAHPWAMFQKILRDVAIVSVFEGNTLFHLSLLAAEIARQPHQDRTHAATVGGRLERVYHLERTEAPIDPRGLTLGRRQSDPAVDALDWVEEQLRQLRADHTTCDSTLVLLGGHLRRVRDEIRACRQAMLDDRDGWTGKAGSLTLRRSRLTARYCELSAAAACFQFWYQNRAAADPFIRRGDWLVVALHRLVFASSPYGPQLPPLYQESVARELFQRLQNGQAFALAPVPIAEALSKFPRSDLLRNGASD
jgi:alkylation response protein AidB-like acyl-CoA dehydrogenase